MPEIAETTTTVQSEEIIRPQHSGELQNIQAAYRLMEKLSEMVQLVRTVLKGKGKISHLMGTGPKLGDPHFEAWDEEDSMIMAWLWNSMIPEISDTCMFLATAKDIWDAIQQTYSKARDAAQVYEGDKDQVSQRCCYSQDFIEQDRVYDFLVGLNPEFDQVRIQILGKQEVPCFNEVVALIPGAESRTCLMLNPQNTESSAMVAGSGNNSATNMERVLVSGNGRSSQPKTQNRDYKDNLWCTYCKKARHTRERCWKLHGKPPSREWGQKGEQPSNNGQAHVTTVQQNGATPQEIGSLNQEEVERVRSLICNLDKPAGATDHMTHSPNIFSTYFPCSSSRKIATVDGSLTTVADEDSGRMIGHARERDGLYYLKASISNKRSSIPFYLIHSDIWGPSLIPNITGAKWSDNAKDYFNQVLTPYFQREEIIHESSCVNTPQQNGVAERKNGHLLDSTRSFLFQKNVPKSFWGEAVLTAAHLINRLPSRILGLKSPMDILSVEIMPKLVIGVYICVWCVPNKSIKEFRNSSWYQSQFSETLISSGQISLAISHSGHQSLFSESKGENAFRSSNRRQKNIHRRQLFRRTFPANFPATVFSTPQGAPGGDLQFVPKHRNQKPIHAPPRAFFRPATASHAPRVRAREPLSGDALPPPGSPDADQPPFLPVLPIRALHVPLLGFFCFRGPFDQFSGVLRLFFLNSNPCTCLGKCSSTFPVHDKIRNGIITSIQRHVTRIRGQI
ncbi:Retrovirus-related Pol polyprotein from transposon TNT 1-94 [Vitis vinifera]|uniref:Retrovirus-related Pol polyprotein from transposon TNT 1-94 n=1 Tax=Vitis vinifera TaxID=29760 RepID=A0A438I6Y3_VITVI|nr:Retrovirus-related Pol polyprotein from transposon TNT 1-94 [Vitis vinifera]